MSTPAFNAIENSNWFGEFQFCSSRLYANIQRALQHHTLKQNLPWFSQNFHGDFYLWQVVGLRGLFKILLILNKNIYLKYEEKN